MIGLLRAMAYTGGAWVIYLLILCSILAVAVMIERWKVLKKERLQQPRVKEIFAGMVEKDRFENTEELSGIATLPARVISSGLSQVSKGAGPVEERMASTTFREKQRLEFRMMILGTLGNNAVYIGLFGTVLGVIKAFHDLAQEGSAGPEVVMQGLSEALLATAAGLLVALPCVVAYNVFQKQIKDLLSETEAMARLLLAQLKSKAKSG